MYRQRGMLTATQHAAQGPSFKATGLQGQAGNGGAASPPDTSAAGPGQNEEEMLELPAGSCPQRITKRSGRIHLQCQQYRLLEICLVGWMLDIVYLDAWLDMLGGLKANEQESHSVFSVNLNLYPALMTPGVNVLAA